MSKHGKEKLYINAPYFELNNQTVWGATALVLSEFKELIYQFDSSYKIPCTKTLKKNIKEIYDYSLKIV